MRRIFLFILLAGTAVGIALYFLLFYHPVTSRRSWNVREWLKNPSAHPDWMIKASSRCNTAPFIFPTDGFIGYLWDDTFSAGHRHQGIDIFGGGEVNTTPVYSVYDGYLTRLEDWKATVIIRIPSDPLQPGRQIWTYYTHMADEDGNSFVVSNFPPGTYEKFVPAGTLLGYQGDYSGTPGNPVGVHLHFSIVLDDGQGNFKNELEIKNTLDPTPYFGIQLNANASQQALPACVVKEGTEDP
jgi:murein DD-endopeptidase MepM/ murein hydrolase activator NlpD